MVGTMLDLEREDEVLVPEKYYREEMTVEGVDVWKTTEVIRKTFNDYIKIPSR